MIMRLWDSPSHYIIVIPHPFKDRWLVVEEGYDDTVIEYLYIPGYPKKIHMQLTDRGIRYIYGSKRLYMRHCCLKYIPWRYTVGSTT